MRVCLNTVIQGWVEKAEALYIDTSGDMEPERLRELARECIPASMKRKINTEGILKRIHYVRLYEASEQVHFFDSLKALLGLHVNI